MLRESTPTSSLPSTAALATTHAERVAAKFVDLETDRRRRSYLRVLNRAWLAFGAVSLVTIPIYPHWQLSLVIAAATGITYLIVEALLRRQHLRAASLAFCVCVDTTFFVMFLTLAALFGIETTFQTEAPVLMLMGLTALFAAALLGARAALLVAVLNTVIVVAVRLSLAPEVEPRPSILVFYWLLAGIAFLYENTLHGVFAELRGVRDGLELSVARRTQELSNTVTRLQQATRDLGAANRDLDLFSAAIAHDLRNPLLIVEGYSRSLQQDMAGQNAEVAQALEKMLAVELRMQRLIDGLLSFARLGEHALQAEHVDVRAIVERLAAELRQLEAERNIDISVDSLPGCRADPVLIEQVLANLLANAIKFTRPREKTAIRVQGKRADGEVIYSIEDNGVGFPMEHAQRLFSPLHRLHAQHDFEGTGIGLAAVERIVRLHGGRVWAKSEPGQGAVFYVALPDAGGD